MAREAVELVNFYVQWHSTDLIDWHVITKQVNKLPLSCSRLADQLKFSGGGPSQKDGKERDPVLRMMATAD